jgi:isopenicillin N synthase-like dioxygenase
MEQPRANLATVLKLKDCEALSPSALRRSLLPQLEACGAAFLCDHGVPQELLQRILTTCAEIHALDDSSKRALDVSKSEGARGYFTSEDIVSTVGEGERKIQRREYRSFEVGCEARGVKDAETSILCADNVWPQGLNAQVVVNEYLEAMWRLAKRIFDIFVRLLELPSDYFNCRLTNPVCQLRLLEYNNDPEGGKSQEPHLSLGAHTDYECFTILVESSPGLQIMARDGSWYSVVSPPGNLLLLMGDLMEVISRGTLESVLHRVLPVQRMRHSCAFFVGLNPDTDIAAADASSFRVGDHLLARMLENFPHLRRRVDAGEITPPPGFGAGNPFKYAKIARVKS